jgi:hypothetical protein
MQVLQEGDVPTLTIRALRMSSGSSQDKFSIGIYLKVVDISWAPRTVLGVGTARKVTCGAWRPGARPFLYSPSKSTSTWGSVALSVQKYRHRI